MGYDEPLFQQVLRYAADADRDVVQMVSGNPDWEPPAALREGLRTYADADVGTFQYPPSEGLTRLRREIAARRGVDADRVLVTNGAGEANYLAMALAFERAGVPVVPGGRDAATSGDDAESTTADLDAASEMDTDTDTDSGTEMDGAVDGHGDATPEVLLTDPVYPYYPARTRLLGGRVRQVPVAADGTPDVAAMRAAASSATAAIVLNTPNNPLGTVYDRETLAELADVAAAVDALLLVDEVYDHFDLSGRFESALSLPDSDEGVVVTSAFSKSMAITGFRVGYAVFPPALVEAARRRHMLVNVTGSRPPQAAVLHALRETPPDYYEATRDLLRERVDEFCAALSRAGASFTRPDGAFYVMARFDGFPGTLENVKRLIDEAGVAAMPGEAFGDARADWLRFALVTDRTGEAADRLAEFFE
jgi:aspartate/methionine/tyrosine aminotransferase